MNAALQRLRSREGMLFLIALAAALPYLNSLLNGFALDDTYIIEQNPRVHTLRYPADQWLTTYWPAFGSELGLYRPLAIWLYALQWAVGGGEPWIYHLANVLLHVVVTVLAFMLLERLTNTTAAAVGALLFAVHPVHTEAVANVVGQAELIAAATTLAACYVFVTRPDTGVSWKRRLVLLALFMTGVLAKENAVVLPALLILCDVVTHRFPPSSVQLSAFRHKLSAFVRYAHDIAMPMLILGLAFGAYLIVRLHVLGNITGTDAGPTLPFLREEYRVLNALRAFPEFIRLLFLPLNLSSDYSPAVILPTEQLTPMATFGALLIGAVVILALLTPRWPAAGFPAAWFAISMVTVSNLFFPIGVLIAERTLYLPSFAVAALVAYLWQAAAPQASAEARRLAPAIVIVLVVALGARSWLRNPDWKSTFDVQNALVRDHPESYRSQWILGSFIWGSGDLPRASYHFELGYRIYPRDSQFLTEYAIFQLALERDTSALRLLRESVAIHPWVPRATLMLAYAEYVNGLPRDAIETAYESYKLGSFTVATLPILAHAYAAAGDTGKSIGAWHALARRPAGRNSRNWTYVARAFAQTGREPEAMAALDSARAIALADTVTERAVIDAAVRTADQVAAAIRAGCYAHARVPGCDPLPDYFRTGSPVQNAKQLQNATEPAEGGAGG